MKLMQSASDDAVLTALGDRIRRHRLNGNRTQAALAREAGISERTLHRMEHGRSAQMTSWIRVLRVLGLLENLDAAVPEPAVSPIQQAERKGRERRRASSSEKPRSEAPWSWGDEE